MIATWYAIVSFMLITYIVLDGRNFGAGLLHWFVAKSPEERRQVIAAMGPLWSWHEVWLVGFGGTLIAAFPRLMASAFSGYYLALMLILWGLIGRGIAIEVGGHINDRLWQTFWDFMFAISNLVLAILFGAAAGNVARGVPLDAQGNFSMAFFTNFRTTGHVGLLDWYTVAVAIFAVLILSAHGATYLQLKTEGQVHDRSERWARHLWIAVVPSFIAISLATWFVRPDLPGPAIRNPFWWFGIILVLASSFVLGSSFMKRHERGAFIGSSFVLVGLLVTGSAAIFPEMLHSTLASENSLTAYEVASSPKALLIASMWWPIGLVLALVYFVFIARRYLGKVSVQRDTQGLY